MPVLLHLQVHQLLGVLQIHWCAFKYTRLASTLQQYINRIGFVIYIHVHELFKWKYKYYILQNYIATITIELTVVLYHRDISDNATFGN